MSVAIPGLARAKRVEETIRVTPFLPVEEEINGVRVKQLTPRHVGILIEARNPFLCGGVAESEDVLQFLWIVSPQRTERPVFAWQGKHFADINAERRREWTKYIAARPNGNRFRRSIDRYVERAFLDKPPPGGGGVAISASWLAATVHKIAFAYGWDDEVILDKPIARLFQYRKWIAAERDPRDTPQFNPISDRATARYLKRANNSR